MYGAIKRNKTLVAVHKKEKIVRKFISEQQEKEELDIIHLNKNLLLHEDIENLYLIQCGNIYVPYELCDVYMESTKQMKYDITQAVDILKKIKGIDGLNKKDIKYINKTINLLKFIIKEDDEFSPDINTLRSLKEFKEGYNLITKR